MDDASADETLALRAECAGLHESIDEGRRVDDGPRAAGTGDEEALSTMMLEDESCFDGLDGLPLQASRGRGDRRVFRMSGGGAWSALMFEMRYTCQRSRRRKEFGALFTGLLHTLVRQSRQVCAAHAP